MKLDNRGACPDSVKSKQKYVDLFNNFGKGANSNIPYDFHKETWRIQSADDDKDTENGYFWEWFLAQVHVF